MGNLSIDSFKLIRDLLDDKPQAWERFHQRAAKAIWSSCYMLTGDEGDAQQAFLFVEQAIQADNYHRLRSYNGSSRIETFIALVARDILSVRIHTFFHLGEDQKGWLSFQRFYHSDIERIIRRRISSVDQQEALSDAYQDICVALVEGQYQRIKAYEGKGSFSGFILHVVDRLLIDIIRKAHPRHRSQDTEHKLVGLVSVDELDEVPSPNPSPEHLVLEEEARQLFEAAAGILRTVMGKLTTDEHLYVRIALSSEQALPAREIANVMQCPVEDVYKLKKRLMMRLEKELVLHPEVKKWLASV